MERVGEFLKREREQRGLSLDEVSQRTKIPRSHLDAIERDEFQSLPSGPFRKGFVVTYARCLNLRPDDVLALAPELSDTANPAPASAGDSNLRSTDIEIRYPNALPGPNRTIGSLVGLIVVALLVIGWLKFGSQIQQRWQGNVATVIRDALPSSSIVPELSTLEDPAPVDNPVATSPAPVLPTENPDKGLAAHASDLAPASNLDARIPSTTQKQNEFVRRLASVVSERDKQEYHVLSDPTHDRGTPQQVVVIAQSKSYLRVSATLDGPAVFEGILNANERKEFASSSDLWMVIGNAGGVEIRYNGHEVSVPGRLGERKGVAFRFVSEP